VTRLRNMVLEELQRRNSSQKTTKAYLRTIWEFARHFHRRPRNSVPSTRPRQSPGQTQGENEQLLT
jgi:hypothetical protein